MRRTKSHGAYAPGPAAPELMPPGNDEAPTVASGQGFKGDGTGDGPDCAARFAVEASDKEFATLRTKLALAGWSIAIVDGGHGRAEYLVSCWGHHRTLPDREAVDAFMVQIGVQP